MTDDPTDNSVRNRDVDVIIVGLGPTGPGELTWGRNIESSLARCAG